MYILLTKAVANLGSDQTTGSLIADKSFLSNTLLHELITSTPAANKLYNVLKFFIAQKRLIDHWG
ncbi:hypothetical protein D3C81_861020 [compost metagenome]